MPSPDEYGGGCFGAGQLAVLRHLVTVALCASLIFVFVIGWYRRSSNLLTLPYGGILDVREAFLIAVPSTAVGTFGEIRRVVPNLGKVWT